MTQWPWPWEVVAWCDELGQHAIVERPLAKRWGSPLVRRPHDEARRRDGKLASPNRLRYAYDEFEADPRREKNALFAFAVQPDSGAGG